MWGSAESNWANFGTCRWGSSRMKVTEAPMAAVLGVSDKDCRDTQNNNGAVACTLLFRPWFWLIVSPEQNKTEE